MGYASNSAPISSSTVTALIQPSEIRAALIQ
jgi:hypothetical protein